MADMSLRHADSARAALRAIVSDPDLGPAALSSPRILANLLKDYLRSPSASNSRRGWTQQARSG